MIKIKSVNKPETIDIGVKFYADFISDDEIVLTCLLVEMHHN